MDGKGATDEPDRAGPSTELVESALSGGYDLRLVTEAQVVVGRENHDIAAPLHLDSSGLRRLQVVQALVHAVALELVELGLEPGSERHAISRMILPASPARIAAGASSTLASGNWWVMTGRASASPPVRLRPIRCLWPRPLRGRSRPRSSRSARTGR